MIENRNHSLVIMTSSNLSNKAYGDWLLHLYCMCGWTDVRASVTAAADRPALLIINNNNNYYTIIPACRLRFNTVTWSVLFPNPLNPWVKLDQSFIIKLSVHTTVVLIGGFLLWETKSWREITSVKLIKEKATRGRDGHRGGGGIKRGRKEGEKKKTCKRVLLLQRNVSLLCRSLVQCWQAVEEGRPTGMKRWPLALFFSLSLLSRSLSPLFSFSFSWKQRKRDADQQQSEYSGNAEVVKIPCCGSNDFNSRCFFLMLTLHPANCHKADFHSWITASYTLRQDGY